jgi:hypothetical protein
MVDLIGDTRPITTRSAIAGLIGHYRLLLGDNGVSKTPEQYGVQKVFIELFHVDAVGFRISLRSLESSKGLWPCRQA